MTHRRRSLQAVAWIVAVVTAVSTSPALANEYATGARQANYFDGIKGNQDIRTDPATVVGVGYNHPIWVVYRPASSFDFVSIGTRNGLGPSGTSCANDYDAKWTVYIDRIINGVYGCWDEAHDLYAAGANPSFEISWGVCSGFYRWVMKFGGVTYQCIYAPWGNAQWIEIGIEVTGNDSVDRNIDAKWTNLKKSYVSSSVWDNFGSCTTLGTVDPNYDVDTVSVTACNTYLPPLN